MGMSLSYFTAAMVLDLPEDGNRYETVHGELLVTPAPRAWHQFVLFRLTHAIAGYLERYPVGVGATGGDISWSDDTLVIPDLLVADPAQARTLSWDSIKNLLLVVEVVPPAPARTASPSDGSTRRWAPRSTGWWTPSRRRWRSGFRRLSPQPSSA